MRSRRATRPVDYQALAGNKGGVWSDSDDDSRRRPTSRASVDVALHHTLPPIKAKATGNHPPRPMSAHAMYAGPHRGGGHRPNGPPLNGPPISPVSAKHSEAAATLIDLFYSMPVEAAGQPAGQHAAGQHAAGQHAAGQHAVHLDLDAAWYTPHGVAGPSTQAAFDPPPMPPTRVKRPREEEGEEEEDPHQSPPLAPPKGPSGERLPPPVLLQWLLDRLAARRAAVAAATTLPAALTSRYQDELQRFEQAATQLLHTAIALQRDGGASAATSPTAPTQGGSTGPAGPSSVNPYGTPPPANDMLREFITQHAPQLQVALGTLPAAAAGPSSVEGPCASTPEGPSPPSEDPPDRANYQVHVPLRQVHLADKEQRLVAQIAQTWQQPGAGAGPGAPGWVLLARIAREVTRRFAAGMVLDAPDAQQLRSFFATLYFAAEAAPCLRETVGVVLAAYEQAGLDAALQELLHTVQAAVGRDVGGGDL